MNNNIKIGWVAGIVDGEGTITLVKISKKNKYNLCPRLLVTMVDKCAIIQLCKILKIGKIRKTKFRLSPNHKYKYVYQINGNNAIKAIRKFYKYLCIKKEQAKILLRYNKYCMFGKTGKRITHKQKYLRLCLLKIMRKLNKRGT